MTKDAIEEYLGKLEDELLTQSAKIPVVLSNEWVSQFGEAASVYVLWEDDTIIFVGETGSLKGRMNDMLNTQNHTVRRNLGKAHFSEHPSFENASSNKSFPDDIENLLNELITKHLKLSFIFVELGRLELKERIFAKLEPKYSIKGKRGTKKSYTKAQKQEENENAYKPWTNEDDKLLELLFRAGKPVRELMGLFERNEGSINARIKKLKLGGK